MKSWVKTMLITGTVLCCVGGICMGAGIVFGGVNYMKHADRGLRELYEMVSDREEVTETGDDQAVVRKKKLGNDFSSVSVFLNNYDLTVLTSTDDNAYLSYDVEKVKNKLPLTWEIKDDTLALTEEKGKCTTVHTREVAGFRKTVTHRNQVTLYLPKGTTLQECKLLLGLGDLQLTGMHTQTLDLRAMAGDVTLTDLSAENGQLCTRDGDIKMAEGSLRNVNVETGLGDTKFTNITFTEGSVNTREGDLIADNVLFSGKVSLLSTLGDMDIRLTGKQKDLHALAVDAQTGLGDIYAPKKFGKVSHSGSVVTLDDPQAQKFAKAFDYYTGTSDDGAYDDSGDDLDDWDEDDESTRLQKKESDEKNLLTIRSYEGDITIKTR